MALRITMMPLSELPPGMNTVIGDWMGHAGRPIWNVPYTTIFARFSVSGESPMMSWGPQKAEGVEAEVEATARQSNREVLSACVVIH